MSNKHLHAPDDGIRLSFEVTPDDCRAAQRCVRRRALEKSTSSAASNLYYAAFTFLSFLGFMFLIGTETQLRGTVSGFFHAALIILFIIIVLAVLWRRHVSSCCERFIGAIDDARCGRVDMSIRNGRLYRVSNRGESWTPLDVIRETVTVEGLLLIFLDDVTVDIIPRRAFTSFEEESAFSARLRGHQPLVRSAQSLNSTSGLNASQNPDPTRDVAPSASTPETAGATTPRTFRRLLRDLFVDIRHGVNMALFRKKGLEGLVVSPGIFTALVLLYVALHILLDIAVNGIGSDTGMTAFIRTLFNVPLMLLAGVLTSRAARRGDLVLAIPTAYLATAVPIDLAAALFQLVTDNFWSGVHGILSETGAFFCFFFWWAAAVLIATMRVSSSARARRFVMAMIQVLIIIVPLSYLWRADQLLDSEDTTTTGQSPAMRSEKAFYAQPILLDTALTGLLPGRKGVVDLYFAGFAGYASEDVFMKEMEVIPQLFEDRFDTAGRSVVLVNNPKTVLKHPVATSTSLERTLLKIGQAMNRDEDILFLYLTSHGSSNYKLSVDLWPLELDEVDPAMLKKMLDKARIRWRVIAISACYSGGFIDPLKNDSTLIMTASDARNNSFGCGSESDFTWFGKALIDEELSRTRSFPDAFQKAKISISKRELKENENPSNPQIYVGKDIRLQLARLEARLSKQDAR